MNSEDPSTPYRCAVYFVPAIHSEWWQAGSHWLGRCAASGASYAPPDIYGVTPAEFQTCTADPRRYGWHATLKAPFSLAAGQNLGTLRSAMRELADSLPAFEMPRLKVSTLGRFLALRPDGDTSDINATAAACVKRLHPLAQPLTEAELARRRQAPLSPEQDRSLREWGYPWVFEHFQFHLSLTGALDGVSPTVKTALFQAAQDRFESLPTCQFAHIALFAEPHAGADFELIEQMELRQ